MNFKQTKQRSKWHHLIDKKFIAIYIALAVVLIINQVVFSYLLSDKREAKAFGSGFGSVLMTDLADSVVYAGASNVLLAQFWVPDPLLSTSVTCNWALGNPCLRLVEADGTATAGAGVDDDGATWFFQTEPSGRMARTFFTPADNVCTDSIATPTCIYIDSDGDCDATSGTQTYILGAACGTAADTSAVTAPGASPFWTHSELVNANGLYDYGNSAATTETIWVSDQLLDTTYKAGSLWALGSATGIYQGDAAGTWHDAGTPGAEMYYDPAAVGHFTGDIAQSMIIDRDADSHYENAADDLMDADGSGTAGIGADDDALNPGDVLVPLKVSDNVCINMLGLGLAVFSGVIIYVDGDGDCVPGSGGTDTIIRDDVGAGLLTTGVFPYTYFNAAGFLVYA
ncbi:MAG: hypothetical protein PHC97_01050, partial [Patescibacteria group bacterium]|nr:hypothetical protein [Patescibacteria group bacterium]